MTKKKIIIALSAAAVLVIAFIATVIILAFHLLKAKGQWIIIN